MAIIVACSCGKSFQAKDEHAGKTGRCPACGNPILIQAAAVMAGVDVEVEEVNPRAAAVQLAREMQSDADKRFLSRMVIIGGGVLAVIAIAVALRIGMAPSTHSNATVVEPPKNVPPPATTTPPAAPATPAVVAAPEPVKPPEPAKPAIDLSSFVVKDDIDRYILLTLKTRDRHTRVNAKIFRPDDPILDFEPEERPVAQETYKKVEERLGKLASKMDLDLGPQPDAATDLIEARMLMDPELIGSGMWLGTQGGRNNYLVFIEEPKLRMAQFTERYGKPQKNLKSGDVTLHFIGRMVLMEGADGSVVGVARRITRIAKLAAPESAK